MSDDKDLEIIRLKRMLAEQSLEILMGYSRVAEYVRIREEYERLGVEIAQRETVLSNTGAHPIIAKGPKKK